MYELFPKRCFTELEAAEYLGMSVNFLRRARTNPAVSVKEGIPQASYIEGRLRYMREDLDSWLDSVKSDSKRGKS